MDGILEATFRRPMDTEKSVYIYIGRKNEVGQVFLFFGVNFVM
jgi:hypothetical protein